LNKRIERLLVIITSEGGPPVVHSILSQLETDFPVPIVICQGYQTGTVKALCNVWNKTSQLTVKYAGDVNPLLPGSVCVLPHNCKAKIDTSSSVPCMVKSRMGSGENEGDPVAKLLESAGEAYGSELKLALAGGQKKGMDEFQDIVQVVSGSGGTVCSVMETGAIATGKLLRKGDDVSLVSSDEFVASLYAWIGRSRKTSQTS